MTLDLSLRGIHSYYVFYILSFDNSFEPADSFCCSSYSVTSIPELRPWSVMLFFAFSYTCNVEHLGFMVNYSSIRFAK